MSGVHKQYTLIDANGSEYQSPTKGAYGGHRKSRLFGRLDCPAALRAIARGGYVSHRVFFADSATAQEAGYRPCAVCMPDAYRKWKDVGASGRYRADAIEFTRGDIFDITTIPAVSAEDGLKMGPDVMGRRQF